MGKTEMDAFVEQVRTSSDIVSVISSYIPLKRKGNRYWGCCPFHNEKTPSFSVVPEQGFFYCFGCHAGGNVFKFLSLIENISYFDAIKMQAEKLAIELPKISKTKNELLHEKKRAELEQILLSAKEFFQKSLLQETDGSTVRRYLTQRELSPQIADEFSLGFAPNSFERLLHTLKRQGIDAAQLLEAGLVAKSDKGTIYDRFRNRLMIPIYNEHQTIVGFGGRILDDGTPKYLNSPETLLFNKRKLLFGLHKATHSIRREDKVIIVEGYMDAISLYAHGITNVVASLGTAFTLEQCHLLLRYTKNLYLSYDSDEAGQKAMLRAVDIAQATGAKIKIIVIPSGKDPDEFIKKHTKEAFQKLVADALPIHSYKLQYLLESHPHDTFEEKTQLLRTMLPILNSIESPLEQGASIKRLSMLFSIDEALIVEELKRSFPKKYHRYSLYRTKTKNQNIREDNAQRLAARTILKLVQQDKAILDHLLASIPLEEFPVEEYKEIFSLMVEKNATGEDVFLQEVEEELSEKARIEFLEALARDENLADISELYTSSLNNLKRAYLERKYEKMRLKADALEREGDSSYLIELQKIFSLQKEIAILKKNIK